jgi:hypothetical protein
MSASWPDSLKMDPGALKALEKAATENAIIGKWPEGEKFRIAHQAEAMAQILVPEFHSDITNAKIVYLFRQHIGGRGQTLAGKASTANARLKFLTEYDFVIELNWTMWANMDVPQRTALLDHELQHCSRDDKESYCILQHDIEEFGAIIQRWGLYNQEAKSFADVCTQQLELLTATA